MAERSRLVRAGRVVLLAALAGVVGTLVLRQAHVQVAYWYLPPLLAAGAVLVTTLRPVAQALTTLPRLPHGAPPPARPEVLALRPLEQRVARATEDPRWFDRRLRPLLLDLARERARRAGADDDALPALIGEDAWRWLRTTDEAQVGGRRPPTLAEVSALIARVESL